MLSDHHEILDKVINLPSENLVTHEDRQLALRNLEELQRTRKFKKDYTPTSSVLNRAGWGGLA